MTNQRRVATLESLAIDRRYATKTQNHLSPALKGRAKFAPTLRVEILTEHHQDIGARAASAG
jgi:hypothetical protein